MSYADYYSGSGLQAGGGGNSPYEGRRKKKRGPQNSGYVPPPHPSSWLSSNQYPQPYEYPTYGGQFGMGSPSQPRPYYPGGVVGPMPAGGGLVAAPSINPSAFQRPVYQPPGGGGGWGGQPGGGGGWNSRPGGGYTNPSLRGSMMQANPNPNVYAKPRPTWAQPPGYRPPPGTPTY